MVQNNSDSAIKTFGQLDKRSNKDILEFTVLGRVQIIITILQLLYLYKDMSM